MINFAISKYFKRNVIRFLGKCLINYILLRIQTWTNTETHVINISQGLKYVLRISEKLYEYLCKIIILQSIRFTWYQ